MLPSLPGLVLCSGEAEPPPSGLLFIILCQAHAVSQQRKGSASWSHVVVASPFVLASWGKVSFMSNLMFLGKRHSQCVPDTLPV